MQPQKQSTPPGKHESIQYYMLEGLLDDHFVRGVTEEVRREETGER